jgi:hypothetical protein
LFDFYGMANFLIEEKMAATKKKLLDSCWLNNNNFEFGAVCSLGHIQACSVFAPVLVANQIATILVIFPC